MGDENKILVTPESLRQMAQRLKELLRKGLRGYEELEKSAQETENCLEGKCARQLRKKIADRKKSGSIRLQSLCTFSEKLLQIAEEYEAAERDNVNG